MPRVSMVRMLPATGESILSCFSSAYSEQFLYIGGQPVVISGYRKSFDICVGINIVGKHLPLPIVRIFGCFQEKCLARGRVTNQAELIGDARGIS